VSKKVGEGPEVFGLWRVRFPPCLVRPGRRLPVQGLSEGSLGFRDIKEKSGIWNLVPIG